MYFPQPHSPPAGYPLVVLTAPLLLKTDDILWCREISEQALGFALQHSPHFLYEVADSALPHAVNALPRAASHAPALLSLCLTTLTCYNAPIAQWFCAALAQYYQWPSAVAEDMRTALHEAIANAVIHGNLRIKGQWKGKKKFAAYSMKVAARLEEPRCRFARIFISAHTCHGGIRINVTDEGQGYSHSQHTRHKGSLPPGRGLYIMCEHTAGMRTSQAGRTVEMDFLLPA